MPHTRDGRAACCCDGDEAILPPPIDRTYRVAHAGARRNNHRTGIIKGLDDDHGSGFIAPDDGAAEVNFHMSQIAEGGFDLLHERERVEFRLGIDPSAPGRTRAERVRPLTW